MKKTYTALFAAIVLAVTLPICTSAQITITSSATAIALASKLTGPGVIVTSPTLTCPDNANGTFTGISSLSFDSGIILTNGTALTSGSVIGAGGPASGFASTANGTPGDPDLDVLAGLTTYDACILEFDFKPAGDTVKFNYVFGSEEYASYTCSSFNDVFGFFISGPGFASATNIALVPGTTIPVCINSVNCGATGGYSTSTCSALGPGSPFCTYYVNNTLGTTITYNGLTTTLTAIAAVAPCNTYHLKIGIADGSDDVYDSGVFLEAGSLTSNGISVTPVGSIPSDTTLGGNFCIRNCSPASFNFSTAVPAATDFVIHFTIGGTAINGIDYTAIPDSIVIPAGGSYGSININGLLPGSATGPVTVQLFILAPYTCSGLPVYIDSPIITIYNSFFTNITTPDTAICIGSTVTLHAQGDPFLHYTWGPVGITGVDTTLNATITPTITATYTLTGTFPGSGCAPATDEVTVNVVQPLTLNVGAPLQNTCVGVAYPLNVSVYPGGGSYYYSWTPIAGISNSHIANPTVTAAAPGNTEYVVTVTESTAGCLAADSFMLHVLPNDFNLLSQDSGICFNGIVQIRASGDPEFSYHWTPEAFVSNSAILTPVVTVNSTTTFTVTGTYPGCPDMVHTVQYYVESPHVNILTNDTSFCLGDTIHLHVAVTPADSPFVFSWSPATNLYNATDLEPYFTQTTVGDYPFTLAIQSPLGCTSSDNLVLSPKPPAMVTVTPGPTTINLGESIQLNAADMTPYPLVYWWVPENGTLDNPNINNPLATPLDSTTYTVYAMNEWGCRDSASVSIGVLASDDVFIPMAFTPNNDGRNDVFRIMNLKYKKLVEFNVFNRWGQIIYHNNSDPSQGWDGTFNGTPQDIGIYNYSITIAAPNGTNKTYAGNVTLLK